MNIIALVILIALVEYMVLGGMVGYARKKYGIQAPATTGHTIFERHFRVHYNTLEQLVIFIPAIWIFGQFFNATWGSILGAVFIVGRALYAIGYVRDPRKREVGALLGGAATAILVLGALYGVIGNLVL